MTWIHFLALALLVVVIAAVTGLKPKKGKPVARTSLMGAARVALFVIAAIFIALAIAGARG